MANRHGSRDKIHTMNNATYSESQLHQFGKMCFEDAAGKTIRLPDPISPMFDPPKTFFIKRVEFEKPIPFAGHTGRQPDVLLTDEHGHKLVVEITNSNSKGDHYLQDMIAVGMSLVLELDVSKWRKQPSLIPDFTQGSPLKTVINQTKWLSCGQPREMEWRPYALVLYECDSEDICNLCQQLRGGFRGGRRGQSLRLFYWSPSDRLATLASRAGLGMDEAREKIYSGLSSFSTDCQKVSILTLSPDEKRIEAIEDRNPDRTHRETGWVLLRDDKELTQFRIRRMPDGFQPVIYGQGFANGSSKGDPVFDFQRNRDENPFLIHRTWKEAVKELFNRLAPGADPIDRLKNDEWNPTESSSVK